MSPAFGYALRERGQTLILEEPKGNACEISLERADDPLRIDRYLGNARFDYVSVHSSNLSPGSGELPPRRYLESIRSVALENGAKAVSDHLGITRDRQDGIELGQFVPVPFTLGAVEMTCRNIDRIQQYFAPLNFFFENISYLFRFEGEMGEIEFLTRVLSRTGCGWLLDVTNVYANSINFGFDPYDFIGRIMPDAARVQIHLAGGYLDSASGTYIECHSHSIPEEGWELYRFALEQAGPKVEAVFLGRNEASPANANSRNELGRAREIALQVSHDLGVLQRAG